jgi:hypothetical protein
MDEQEKEKEPLSPMASLVSTLVTGAVFYTVLGLGAGILYSYASTVSTVGLPIIGLMPFLALWWAYVLVASAPILFGVILFRATDPVLLQTTVVTKSAR